LQASRGSKALHRPLAARGAPLTSTRLMARLLLSRTPLSW
jgi:hypothetical protein